MSSIDRAIRFLLVGVAALLIMTDRVAGLTAVLMMLGAIAFLTSGLTGYCPLYAPFKLDTSRRK